MRNSKAYNHPKWAKRITLEVVVALDSVPGAFHQVEDHINYICQLPYVESVTQKS